jgi:hypothetical protein
VQPQIFHPGTVAVPAAISESPWNKLDRMASYVFTVVILGGGMFIPLGLAVYSLFFRDLE